MRKNRLIVYSALLIPAFALGLVPSKGRGVPTRHRAPVHRVEIMMSISTVAEQLGVKLEPRPLDDEFRIGLSVSGTLERQEKLERFGIKGMKNGARVTMSRVATDRVRIDADQFAPDLVSARADVKVDETGHLIAAPKA